MYKEQLEEMLALPKVLKETHIKLQEETDLRVLAEETMHKLERDIKQVKCIVMNHCYLVPIVFVV